jgi:hypothetical protein
MAKLLANAITLIFWKGDDIMGRVDYEVTSDDLEVSRSIDLILTDQQKTTIINFALNVAIPQIKAKENIT